MTGGRLIQTRAPARNLLVLGGMPTIAGLIRPLVLAVAVCCTSCSRTEDRGEASTADDMVPVFDDRAPTVGDLQIARRAIQIGEIAVMLGGGVPEENIISEINQRHVPEKINAAAEIGLVGRGAGPALIAALKNPENVLTEVQRAAYAEHLAQNTTTKRPQPSNREEVIPAEEKERQRLLGLQKDGFRIAEQRRVEQVERERRHTRELEDRRRSMEKQNSSRETYGITRSSRGYYDSRGCWHPYR